MKVEKITSEWHNVYSLPPGILAHVSRNVKLSLFDWGWDGDYSEEGIYGLFGELSDPGFSKLKFHTALG